ncbi:MAG: hypothetical protein MHMPM18_002264 [Marteilia pararefringens]
MNKKNKNSNLPLGDLIKLGSKSKSTSNKQNVQIPPKKVTPVSHSSKNSETQSKTKKDPLNNPLASNQSIIKKQINDTISQILLKCSSNIKDAKAHIDDKNSFNLTDLVLDLLQYISDDILNYSNIITIALTAVLKLDAGVFNNKEIVALCAIILKNFSNLIPKSNCELVYEQSFISIVLISFQDYDEWPIEFFESYLYDALNYKQDLKWSTDPVNHTFVENIKTAFISHIDDKVRNYKHNAAIACNELLNEKIEANIFPRYVSRVDSVSSAFRKIISMDQISQVTENSSNILNICLKTENLAPCKIICINVFETLIQHPKNFSLDKMKKSLFEMPRISNTLIRPFRYLREFQKKILPKLEDESFIISPYIHEHKDIYRGKPWKFFPLSEEQNFWKKNIRVTIYLSLSFTLPIAAMAYQIRTYDI